MSQHSKASESSVILLDGGMGHQLKMMGIPITGKVGTMGRFLNVVVANIKHPELVRNAHLAFIDAGAEIIITNNYAAVPKCLQHHPNFDGDCRPYIKAAGQRAREACNMRPDRNVKIAGSIPPLAESYRFDLVGSFESNLEQYRIIASSIAPFSDVILCETMSTADEAKAACTAAAETGLPVWVSWTLDENKPVLRSGESVKEAINALADLDIEAYLFNCTSPEIITTALSLLPKGAKIGAYANGFVTATEGSGEYRDLTGAEYYEQFVHTWIQNGACIVGGCCGIFPKHIAHIHTKTIDNKTRPHKKKKIVNSGKL